MLYHIVCSQCCKLALDSYSEVRDKSKQVSDQRPRWEMKGLEWMQSQSLKDRKINRNKAG